MSIFLRNMQSVKEKYQKYIFRKIAIILAMVFLCLILFIVSLAIGSAKLSFIETLKAFFNVGDDINITIVRKIRLPKSIAAIIAGAGLSLSGCIMQSVLKNDMASPSTLGVSNGAVFGANFAIIVLNAGSIHAAQGLNINISNPYIVTICAFIFAFLETFLILTLSLKKKFVPSAVVLAGVAFGMFFAALTTILQYFAIDNQLASAVFWSFGDLQRVTNRENLIMAIVVIFAFIFFMFNMWNFNSFSSNVDIAKTLGVNVELIRFLSLLISSLICATIVSFLGIIGFVGLIAPHIAKKIIGNDHRYLIPASLVFGSLVLLIAYIISSLLSSSLSMPIGAITSIIGAPIFIWLLLFNKKEIV